MAPRRCTSLIDIHLFSLGLCGTGESVEVFTIERDQRAPLFHSDTSEGELYKPYIRLQILTVTWASSRQQVFMSHTKPGRDICQDQTQVHRLGQKHE